MAVVTLQLGHLPCCALTAMVLPVSPQMRSLREKVQQLREGHEAQIGAVLEQFGALRQQVCCAFGVCQWGLHIAAWCIWNARLVARQARCIKSLGACNPWAVGGAGRGVL